MINQLIFSNIHFIVQVFSALVFFFTGWLYFDSWKAEKGRFLLLNFLGFMLLSLSYLIHSINISSPDPNYMVQLVKITALVLLAGSILSSPEVNIPLQNKASLLMLPFLNTSLVPLTSALFLINAILVAKSYRVNLNKQLFPLIWGFSLLFISESVNIGFFWLDTQNVALSQLLANYGLFWWSSRLFQLIGVLIFAKWTWGYIRFRPGVQLFTILTSSVLLVFLATTALFTSLLLKNIKDSALKHLETDIKVMELTLDSLISESSANAKLVSANKEVVETLVDGDYTLLKSSTDELLKSIRANFIQILDPSSKVVSESGASPSTSQVIGFSLVEQAQSGKDISAVVVEDSVIAKVVRIHSAIPIYENPASRSGTLLGVSSTGFEIDTAFVDGLKKTTGLEVSILAGEDISTTTLISPDGQTRLIGTKLSKQEIYDTVLKEGRNYVGDATIFNEPFYVVAAPLRDDDGQAIGILFMGRPQVLLLEAARRSLNLTFIGSAILMVLAAVPAYFASKYIKEHITA